jgi:hypothetical protein
VHAEPSHWLCETLISKIVCHHFWPGQIPGAQIAGYSIAICISVSKQFLSKQQSDDRLLGAVEKWLHFFRTLKEGSATDVSHLFPFGPHSAKKSPIFNNTEAQFRWGPGSKFLRTNLASFEVN